MCLICDGYTYDDVRRQLDLTVLIHGWALQSVQGDDTAWAYTIGLRESFGHPELVVTDLRAESHRELIDPLVEMIIDTGALDPAVLADEGVRVREVHRDHLNDDLLGMWCLKYGRLPPPGSFLQVLAPDDWFCSCHQNAHRRLDLPVPRRPPGPKRAERRAAARRARRH